MDRADVYREGLMRIASIDIGTNTILMLIADVYPGGRLDTVSDEQIIARLGKGVDANKRIDEAAYERCKAALEEYKRKAEALGAERIIVTGTSALRDAANRTEFLDRILNETGLRIGILSGDDEAQYTYLGAIAGMPQPKQKTAVLDIGGGSTELTIGEGTQIIERKSLDIGCVRLTERFLSGPPPAPEELESLSRYIKTAMEEYPVIDTGETHFVAVAGTATTLAAVDLGLESYDRHAVSGHMMTRDTIASYLTAFSSMTHNDLVAKMKVDPGRADIILTGIVILHSVMERFDIEVVTVSPQGLRYGIAMRAMEVRG